MASAALAPISLGLGVASGIAGMIGSGQQSSAQAQMYQYQAGIAKQNQAIAKQNETYALMSGEQQAAKSGMATRYREGEIKTAQAASGFDVNKGTAVDVRAGQEKIGQMEQTAIRSSSAKAAYDYDVSAFQAGEQAQLYTAAASNVKSAAPLAQAASFLGSASSVASKWMSFNQSGALNNFSFGF